MILSFLKFQIRFKEKKKKKTPVITTIYLKRVRIRKAD